jgi:DNA-binding transcriptional ArsR family regulator
MNETVFKAMADPTRRKIIELLKEGPKTASEIADHFTHTKPTVSRHLSVLKNANLVVDQRQGTFIVYQMNAIILQDWLVWLLEHFGDIT